MDKLPAVLSTAIVDSSAPVSMRNGWRGVTLIDNPGFQDNGFEALPESFCLMEVSDHGGNNI